MKKCFIAVMSVGLMTACSSEPKMGEGWNDILSSALEQIQAAKDSSSVDSLVNVATLSLEKWHTDNKAELETLSEEDPETYKTLQEETIAAFSDFAREVEKKKASLSEK